jgi:hypothetical protein
MKKILLIAFTLLVNYTVLNADIYTTDNTMYISDTRDTYITNVDSYNSDYEMGIERQRNEDLINNYKSKIRTLQKRNQKIDSLIYNERKYNRPPVKNKYSRKLYEETTHSYIYRIKLNGNKISNFKSFHIQNGYFKVEMQDRYKRPTSKYHKTYKKYEKRIKLKRDVNNKRISYKVKGDYLEIVMPRYDRKKYRY